MNLLEAMVVFIFNSKGEILLFEKLVKYCAGHLVGPGGKVEAGESLRDAAIRETRDECGLTVVLNAPLGTVMCHNQADMSDILVHMFRTDVYNGTIRNSEPEKHHRMAWYPINDETLSQMMEGDRAWFQHILTGTRFKAEVWYDASWHLSRSVVDPPIS